MLKFLRGIFSNDVSMDLGTANTLIYVRGQGIVLNEPSVVAVRDSHGQEVVEAVGLPAKMMLGRTPMHIKAIRPLKDGVIADFKITEKMLQYFISQVHRVNFITPSPRVLVCVPCKSTQVERRAIIDSTLSAGARKVVLLDEPVAAALGAGLDISAATGSMVVDIGGGTTEIAVLSLGGLVFANSVRIGGDLFDESIVQYVRQKYNSIIGLVTAEKIKHKIGIAHISALKELGDENTFAMRVRNLAKGIPQELIITSEEVLEALKIPLDNIAEAVKAALERTDSEIISDIAENGIVLAGGGALLRGMDTLLGEAAGLPVYVVDEPLNCVARGGGIALEMYDSHRLDIYSTE
jgi:rod shape-determining protein MreB